MYHDSDEPCAQSKPNFHREINSSAYYRHLSYEDSCRSTMASLGRQDKPFVSVSSLQLSDAYWQMVMLLRSRLQSDIRKIQLSFGVMQAIFFQLLVENLNRWCSYIHSIHSSFLRSVTNVVCLVVDRAVLRMNIKLHPFRPRKVLLWALFCRYRVAELPG
jgi:hypothetical protein